jgi:septal ring factor EnvC (AmiA/AmiB activator)
MRYVFLLLFISSTALAAPTYTRQQIIDQMRKDIAQQSQELTDARKHSEEAIANSQRLQDELAVAQAQVNEVAKERESWRAYGDDQHNHWLASEKRVSDQKVIVLRLGIILGLVLLLNGAYAFAKFYLRIPFL